MSTGSSQGLPNPRLVSIFRQDPGIYPLRPFAHPDKFFEKIGLGPVPKRTEWGKNGGTARLGDQTGGHHSSEGYIPQPDMVR